MLFSFLIFLLSLVLFGSSWNRRLHTLVFSQSQLYKYLHFQNRYYHCSQRDCSCACAHRMNLQQVVLFTFSFAQCGCPGPSTRHNALCPTAHCWRLLLYFSDMLAWYLYHLAHDAEALSGPAVTSCSLACFPRLGKDSEKEMTSVRSSEMLPLL